MRTVWPCPVTAELLWTAPELLRVPGAPGRGTLKADIFSIGIVLQEVLTRGPPYSSSGLSAEGTAPLFSFHGLPLAGVPMVLGSPVAIRKSSPGNNHTDMLAWFDSEN